MLFNSALRFEGTLGKVNSWRVRKILGMDPRNPLEEVWRSHSKEEIKELYEDNLRIVLQSCSDLLKDLEGTSVITSDHGELLGEKGMWEHPSEKNVNILRVVPWLKVQH